MRIGSLCTGYGGLDMAVAQHYGATLAWVSDIEPAARVVLEALHPDVPNLGDLTAVDWTQVEPIDVLTAGFPCQPFSHAGKRLGVKDERHLWPYITEAVSALRPRLAVFENVLGLLSIMEERNAPTSPDHRWGVDDGAARIVRRPAFLSVLGDLAALGYGARWGVVRASDAGAPHQRARIFIVAADTEGGRRGAGQGLAEATAGRVGSGTGDNRGPAADADGCGHGREQDARRVGRVDDRDAGAPRQRQWARGESDAGSDQPAADADAIGRERSGDTRRRGTGPEDDGGATADAASSGGRALGTGGDGSRRADGSGGSGQPTANAERGGRDGRSSEPERGPQRRVAAAGSSGVDWGKYEPAIRRWERLTRPAPAPTVLGAKGRPRLSPWFVEWLMGLDEGHVTGHGLTIPQQLKLLGNGVVPQQALLALSLLDPIEGRVAA